MRRPYSGFLLIADLDLTAVNQRVEIGEEGIVARDVRGDYPPEARRFDVGAGPRSAPGIIGGTIGNRAVCRPRTRDGFVVGAELTARIDEAHGSVCRGAGTNTIFADDKDDAEY